MTSMDHLDHEQTARVEALQAARDVGKTIPSLFGGTNPPDTTDLVDLAEYIISGTHPMDAHYARVAMEAQRGPVMKTATYDEVQPDGCGGAVD